MTAARHLHNAGQRADKIIRRMRGLLHFLGRGQGVQWLDNQLTPWLAALGALQRCHRYLPAD
jgi:hypothetical protein